MHDGSPDNILLEHIQPFTSARWSYGVGKGLLLGAARIVMEDKLPCRFRLRWPVRMCRSSHRSSDLSAFCYDGQHREVDPGKTVRWGSDASDITKS